MATVVGLERAAGAPPLENCMPRSIFASTAGCLAAIAPLLVGTPASAGETQQGPMPTYAPPPNYAPPPSYTPPPSYAPAQSSGPTYAPAPSYAPPPSSYGGGSRYAANWDLARPGWEVAGLLGFGASSIYGFGIGVRGGYTLPQRVYVGGQFGYYFGGSTLGDSYAIWNLTAEVGYEIPLAAVPIIIRPYGGLGFEGVSVSSPGLSGNPVCAGGVCAGGSSFSGFMLMGGAVGTWNFTPNWFAGADARLMIPTFGNTYSGGPSVVAFALAATGGYKF